MITQGLFTLLTGNPAIAALISTRMYPVLLQQDAALPALTYQVIAGRPRPTLATAGMHRLRIQFDCFGKDYGDAVALRDALIEALNGYQGTLSDGTVLQNAQLITGTDGFEHDQLSYRAMVEFYFYFN